VRYPHGAPHTDHTVWARPADHMRPPGQPGYGPPPGSPTRRAPNRAASVCVVPCRSSWSRSSWCRWSPAACSPLSC